MPPWTPRTAVFPSLCSDDEPSPLLLELVAKKELGEKTGSGFLEWPPGRADEAAERLDRHLLRRLNREGEIPSPRPTQ